MQILNAASETSAGDFLEVLMQSLCQLFPVVNTLYKINKKNSKHYCYPAQLTILEHLETYYGIKRSVATLNRWLRKLEDDGMFKRVRRIARGSDGKIQFRSTMYFIKLKGLKHLNRFGYDVWEDLKAAVDKIEEKRKNRKKKAEDDRLWRENYNKMLAGKRPVKPPAS